MTHFQMYLITRADMVHTACAILAMVSLLANGFFGLLWLASNADGDLEVRKTCASVLKKIFPLLFIFAAIFCFVPNERDIYKIYIVPKIVNNETIKADCKELYDLAIEALKEKIKPKEERK